MLEKKIPWREMFFISLFLLTIILFRVPTLPTSTNSSVSSSSILCNNIVQNLPQRTPPLLSINDPLDDNEFYYTGDPTGITGYNYHHHQNHQNIRINNNYNRFFINTKFFYGETNDFVDLLLLLEDSYNPFIRYSRTIPPSDLFAYPVRHGFFHQNHHQQLTQESSLSELSEDNIDSINQNEESTIFNSINLSNNENDNLITDNVWNDRDLDSDVSLDDDIWQNQINNHHDQSSGDELPVCLSESTENHQQLQDKEKNEELSIIGPKNAVDYSSNDDDVINSNNKAEIENLILAQDPRQMTLLLDDDNDIINDNNNYHDDDYCLNTDPMLGINCRTEEEILLIDSTVEGYTSSGPNWQFGSFNHPASSNNAITANNTEFPIFDGQGCNMFDGSDATPTLATNATVQQYSANANQNDFGSVVYSSLTTLSNDPVVDAQDENNAHNIHPYTSGTDGYGTSVAGSFQSSATNSGAYFYQPQANGNVGLVEDEEDFNLRPLYIAEAPVMTANNQNGYDYQPLVSLSNVSNSENGGDGSRSVSKRIKLSNSEDCFDKNSDSAVSSMSSDRIQSLSDQALIDTSSESSGYNIPGGVIGVNSAQKKYRLFGRNNTGSPKSEYHGANGPQKNDSSHMYYPDYGQLNHNYIYPSSATALQSQENYHYSNPSNNNGSHQINNAGEYYSVVDVSNVAHNHTYVSDQMVGILGENGLPSERSWQQQQPASTIPSSNAGSSVRNNNKSSKNNRKNSNAIAKAIKSISGNEDSQDSHDSGFNRDEKRARDYNIPIPIQDIINLPIDEFNERLTKYELTDTQLSLIRDIRRRGKNKVAAQNCRKRKLDQIVSLRSQVQDLNSEKNQIQNELQSIKTKKEMLKSSIDYFYQYAMKKRQERGNNFETFEEFKFRMANLGQHRGTGATRIATSVVPPVHDSEAETSDNPTNHHTSQSSGFVVLVSDPSSSAVNNGDQTVSVMAITGGGSVNNPGAHCSSNHSSEHNNDNNNSADNSDYGTEQPKM